VGTHVPWVVVVVEGRGQLVQTNRNEHDENDGVDHEHTPEHAVLHAGDHTEGGHDEERQHHHVDEEDHDADAGVAREGDAGDGDGSEDKGNVFHDPASGGAIFSWELLEEERHEEFLASGVEVHGSDGQVAEAVDYGNVPEEPLVVAGSIILPVAGVAVEELNLVERMSEGSDENNWGNDEPTPHEVAVDEAAIVVEDGGGQKVAHGANVHEEGNDGNSGVAGLDKLGDANCKVGSAHLTLEKFARAVGWHVILLAVPEEVNEEGVQFGKSGS